MGRRGAGTPHPLSVYPMAGGGISRPPGKNFHVLGSMGRDRICRMDRIGLEHGFWGKKGRKGKKGREERGWGTSSIKTRLCLSPLHALSVLLCRPCQAFQSCKSRKSCRKCPRQRQRRGWRTTGNGAASPRRSAAGGVFGQDLQDGQDCLREWEKMCRMWLGRGREGLWRKTKNLPPPPFNLPSRTVRASS